MARVNQAEWTCPILTTRLHLSGCGNLFDITVGSHWFNASRHANYPLNLNEVKSITQSSSVGCGYVARPAFLLRCQDVTPVKTCPGVQGADPSPPPDSAFSPCGLVAARCLRLNGTCNSNSMLNTLAADYLHPNDIIVITLQHPIHSVAGHVARNKQLIVVCLF